MIPVYRSSETRESLERAWREARRKLRAARGSGITATRLGLWLSSGHLLLSGDGLGLGLCSPNQVLTHLRWPRARRARRALCWAPRASLVASPCKQVEPGGTRQRALHSGQSKGLWVMVLE